MLSVAEADRPNLPEVTYLKEDANKWRGPPPASVIKEAGGMPNGKTREE